MNRTPSSRPSPPVGEKVPGGRLRGIPTGSWLRFTIRILEVFSTNEPPLTPSLSPSDGERVAGGRLRGCFMVRMGDCEVVEASYEPGGGETPV